MNHSMSSEEHVIISQARKILRHITDVFASIQQQGSLKHQSAFRIELVKLLFVCLGSCIAWWLVSIYVCQIALRTGWKTIDSKGHKTAMRVLCVGVFSMTIEYYQNTSLPNFGRCIFISTFMDSIAAHMSQSTITPLVQHIITLQNPADPSNT